MEKEGAGGLLPLKDFKSVVVISSSDNNRELCSRILVRRGTQLLELVRISKDRYVQYLHHIRTIIGLYDRLNNYSCMQPLIYRHEDSNSIDIVFKYSSTRSLRELVATRGCLTEYEAKYFAREVYFVLCSLREKGLCLGRFSCADVRLDDSMTIQFGFLMGLAEIPKTPTGEAKPCSASHYLPAYKDYRDMELKNSRNIGVCLYEMLEGKILSVPDSHRRSSAINFVVQFSRTPKDSPYRHLIRDLLETNRSRKTCLKDIFSENGLLGGEHPAVLPRTIKLCPPSSEFQLGSCTAAERSNTLMETGEVENVATISTRTSKFTKYRTSEAPLTAFELANVGMATFKYIFNLYICESAEDLTHVQYFCDISTTLGYGYRMSTGLVGFYFNDKTLLVVLPNDKTLFYFDENWEMRSIREDKITYSNDIKKKYYILLCYLKSLTKMERTDPNCRLIYVKQYIRTKNARLLLISNNSVQATFVDRTQVLTTNSYSYFYGKKQGCFRLMKQDAEDPEVLLRERYTKELGKKLLGWISAADDYCIGQHEDEYEACY